MTNSIVTFIRDAGKSHNLFMFERFYILPNHNAKFLQVAKMPF